MWSFAALSACARPPNFLYVKVFVLVAPCGMSLSKKDSRAFVSSIVIRFFLLEGGLSACGARLPSGCCSAGAFEAGLSACGARLPGATEARLFGCGVRRPRFPRPEGAKFSGGHSNKSGSCVTRGRFLHPPGDAVAGDAGCSVSNPPVSVVAADGVGDKCA